MDHARDLQAVQKAVGYRFRDPALLRQALTHRSFVHEHLDSRPSDNETLEFLGDAVLGLAVSHLLIERFPERLEGDLSRMRSAIVNERQLAQTASELGLGRRLLLGKGEELTGGREKASLLADSLEALLGAVYLDGGFDAVFQLVSRLFSRYLDAEHLDDPLSRLDKDYKTQLQEWTQARFKTVPTYEVESEEGPDHEKTFTMRVSLGEVLLGRGVGRSKKDAQQEAARKALEVLKERVGEAMS
jgi:ribonuclease-3